MRKRKSVDNFNKILRLCEWWQCDNIHILQIHDLLDKATIQMNMDYYLQLLGSLCRIVTCEWMEIGSTYNKIVVVILCVCNNFKSDLFLFIITNGFEYKSSLNWLNLAIERCCRRVNWNDSIQTTNKWWEPKPIAAIQQIQFLNDWAMAIEPSLSSYFFCSFSFQFSRRTTEKLLLPQNMNKRMSIAFNENFGKIVGFLHFICNFPVICIVCVVPYW